MAVDKRIPRVLNSDADSKTINKVSMLDALNVYSGPDNEELDICISLASLNIKDMVLNHEYLKKFLFCFKTEINFRINRTS